MNPAYYNENNKYAAEWLRNLIDAGCIAPGVVDDRSIEDVLPSDLRGFTQCHFFAGVGVWSYALRQAGWADDRPVWTGSCPCQPFSAAGKGTGFADERHLWPAFHHLIKECKAPTVFGEQVASKDAGPWIDLVQTDLETLGYAFGAVPFPSAGVGAPHIRDRTYWSAISLAGRRMVSSRGFGTMADTGKGQRGRRPNDGALLTHRKARGRHENTGDAERHRGAGGLEHTRHHHDAGQVPAACAGQSQANRPANITGGSGLSLSRLDNPISYERRTGRDDHTKHDRQQLDAAGHADRPSPTNGFWRAADWLLCRDGKWRPVEPGTFPLAHGAPARVGRLRAYGNAINSQSAKAFIESFNEYIGG